MVGTPKFEAFANYYIQSYKFKTVTSEEFKDCFMNYFKKEETVKGAIEKIDWDKWFYTPGLTEAPKLDKTLAKNAETLSKAWLNFEVTNKKPALTPAQFAEWSTTQKILFLEGLLSAQEERWVTLHEHGSARGKLSLPAESTAKNHFVSMRNRLGNYVEKDGEYDYT